LQVLFGPGERYIVTFLGGALSLKWDGLFLGLTICCRLAALMVLLPVLTAAGPHEIAMGLNRLGLNYSACYIVSAAINLIPVFEEEARSIMDAQKLRGLSAFEEGSFPEKLRAYPALAVPLVLSAMRRARFAAVAMDARAFGAYKTRTWLDLLKFKKADCLSFAACAVFAALILILNYALKQGNCA
jgi:energy-coupling factor transport system permease protein